MHPHDDANCDSGKLQGQVEQSAAAARPDGVDRILRLEGEHELLQMQTGLLKALLRGGGTTIKDVHVVTAGNFYANNHSINMRHALVKSPIRRSSPLLRSTKSLKNLQAPLGALYHSSRDRQC